MKIAIIGIGYVGLPTGVGFAELGHDVVCIDGMRQKIDELNAGKVPMFEDGLEELLHKNTAAGKIKFTTDIRVVKDVDFIIIAVGTPSHPVTMEVDMRYVYAAAEEFAPYLSGYTVVANKSTVLIGTAEKVGDIIRTKNPNADFDVISMPEFLREGFAVHDFLNPDRVVIGTDSDRARKAVEELYSVYPKTPDILFVDRRSAELIKYASNAFLAMKIHYINEMADLCEKTGANVYDVAKGMGLDSRIGNKFLNPGPGYGGSCFPKDTYALAYMARHIDVDLSLVEATIAGNVLRRSKMAKKIISAVKDIEKTEKPVIAVWGLAFKEKTDDVRESPALQIVQELVSRNYEVVAFDPRAKDTAFAVLGDSIKYADSAIEAAKGADILVVLTEWLDFKKVPLEKLEMRSKNIIDLRNVINADAAKSAGFFYEVIGK